MLINLKEIFLTENIKKKYTYQFDMRNISVNGINPLDVVHVSACAENSAGLVTLDIEASFDYEAPCDRCGKITKKNFIFNFNHTVVTSVVGDVDDEYIEAPDYVIDIEKIVFDDVILSLPGKFLCNDECKGLCQFCGKNLNEGACNCSYKQIDPRLESLRDLLK